MQSHEIVLPLSPEALRTLRAGDIVRLTGEIFTARDAAHKRMAALLSESKPLPLPIEGACVYYAGPCPAAPGEILGPCGPTTSGRVDRYTPELLARGLSAMIGKGPRTPEVIEAMRGRAVYFVATGGAACLISEHVKAAETVAFPELGAEAIRRLRVEGLPLVVAIDAQGGSLYQR